MNERTIGGEWEKYADRVVQILDLSREETRQHRATFDAGALSAVILLKCRLEANRDAASADRLASAVAVMEEIIRDVQASAIAMFTAAEADSREEDSLEAPAGP